ncbi:rhomboid family intramembrane serine protease [Steroidobacter sp. S1-65]|uniref:Rhomboid family intramembrane serine protease n=1 Tax=Steroidobacter gossypii TaxID=2805490 RepID=A0ABS1X273_9GAMM|nr:rhomboid family intramembrane serine protease [Steroidobacter gossypii]MBM0107294.1 rhomboid family intramembrane serine protease [Steroidobacter gossypii]
MTQADAPPNLVEVFRSLRMPDCDQQTLILSAVGIHSWTVVRGGMFVVVVPEDSADLARHHLREVAQEAVAPALPMKVPKPRPRAWHGSVLYALVMIAVAYVAGRQSFGFDWLAVGSLNGAIPSSQEWWRVVTALTLHADVGHLLSNLLFGVVLGFLASRAVGGGVAWGGILLGAMMGNALDALWMPVEQNSIGASTAVFAALGMLSAYAWMLESSVHLRWAKRFGPLIAGVILLGFLGAGGERTDVVAHVTGFASGCLLGLLLGKIPEQRFESRALQLATGACSLAIVGIAWLLALR